MINLLIFKIKKIDSLLILSLKKNRFIYINKKAR